MNQILQILIHKILLAKPDFNATCQRFSETNCVSYVFYNVFVNQTYDQSEMNADVQTLLVLGTYPGVSSSCRDSATILACGTYFQDCETSTYNGRKSFICFFSTNPSH